MKIPSLGLNAQKQSCVSSERSNTSHAFLERVGALLVVRMSLALLDTEPELCGWCCYVFVVLGRSESRILKKCHYSSSMLGGSH